MMIPVCPRCGEYWDEEFCDHCGHADDSFRKIPVKKFKKRIEDSSKPDGKGLVIEP